MISLITGTISTFGPNYVIIATASGVGYKVFVSTTLLQTTNYKLQTLTLHTHTHVREDTLALYGFATEEELNMFELLLTVNGVGPKLALAVLSSFTPSQISQAISTADAALLQTVSGLGKKNAAKIILELKNRIGAIPMTNKDQQAASGGLGEVIEALTGLGYSQSEAKSAIANLDATTPLQENLKQALKNLANK
jgi:Holliday junction DNA helicase RuvA